jgi:hypothetical protein
MEIGKSRSIYSFPKHGRFLHKSIHFINSKIMIILRCTQQQQKKQTYISSD